MLYTYKILNKHKNMDKYWQKVHRFIKFNQKAWLKQYIDMNTELRKKPNMTLRNIFSTWWTMEFLEKLYQTWDIKLVTNESRKYYLVSEHNYHTTEIFSGNWLAIELKRTQIIMNKSVYLGLPILELSNIAMYTFWYDCVKPKCG